MEDVGFETGLVYMKLPSTAPDSKPLDLGFRKKEFPHNTMLSILYHSILFFQSIVMETHTRHLEIKAQSLLGQPVVEAAAQHGFLKQSADKTLQCSTEQKVLHCARMPFSEQ